MNNASAVLSELQHTQLTLPEIEPIDSKGTAGRSAARRRSIRQRERISTTPVGFDNKLLTGHETKTAKQQCFVEFQNLELECQELIDRMEDHANKRRRLLESLVARRGKLKFGIEKPTGDEILEHWLSDHFDELVAIPDQDKRLVAAAEHDKVVREMFLSTVSLLRRLDALKALELNTGK